MDEERLRGVKNAIVSFNAKMLDGATSVEAWLEIIMDLTLIHPESLQHFALDDLRWRKNADAGIERLLDAWNGAANGWLEYSGYERLSAPSYTVEQTFYELKLTRNAVIVVGSKQEFSEAMEKLETADVIGMFFLRLIDRWTDWLLDRLNDWTIEWWSIDRLIVGLIDWLIGDRLLYYASLFCESSCFFCRLFSALFVLGQIIFCSGVDGEWKPDVLAGYQRQHGVSILQLATREHVYLLDFLSLRFVLDSGDWRRLSDVFASPTITKLGFAFAGDFDRMRDIPAFDKEITSRYPNLFDLKAVVKRLASEKPAIFGA